MDASGDAKTFVVTGVTSGIGLALARALAHTAERLVIVSRNEARLHAATEATRHEELNVEILPILADLGTLEGTRSLAEQLDRLPRIDALIHNAGILPAQRRLTPDGFEEGFVPRAAEIGWRRTTDYAAFCESSTDLEMSAAS
jgi:dehydrogenase/reductase SDR family protein 12